MYWMICLSSLPNAFSYVSLYYFFSALTLPSVLWCCWLGVTKTIRPIKIEWWGSGMVMCLERGANDLHIVQLMPLPPLSSLASLYPVYTKQPLVKPDWQPVGCLYTPYSRLSMRFHNRFHNRFRNWLNVCIHNATGCQTGLTTGLTTVCIVQMWL